MDEEKIAAVSRALRSDEHRSKALSVLSKIDSLSEELAETWADDVVFALNEETSAYTKYELLKQLERIAECSPRSVLSSVPVVVSEVSAGLKNTGGDNPEENTKVRRGALILRSVVDKTDVSDGRLDVDSSDVSAFFKWGNSDHRALAYRLLGRSASPDAIGKLVQDVSYEFEDVADARRTALEDARQIVLISISEGHPLDHVETVVSFAELYTHGVLDPDPDTVERVRRTLFDTLTDASVDQRDDLLSSVSRLARTDSDLAESMALEAFELLDGDYRERDDAWSVLSEIAEGAPAVIMDQSDRLSGCIHADGSGDTQEALGVVSTAADRLSTTPADLAEATIRTLDSNDKHVILDAIEAVVSMGIYPPPSKLEELDDGNTDVAKAASKARKRLSKESEGGSQITKSLEDGASVRLFGTRTEGDLYLKQRTEEGIWVDLDIGTVTGGIVEETIEAANRGENVPIVLPYYAPSDIVLIGIALALTDPSTHRQIGLYTPGSQTQWGTKGQVREELSRFGLSDVEGDVASATPIPDVIPHAYVWDGEVREDSDGTGPGRFIVCKQLHDFEEVGDLDIAVLNMTARTREDTQERIRDVEKGHPDVTLVNAYSYYTKNEGEGRPRYGPPSGLGEASTVPSVATLDPVVDRGPFHGGERTSDADEKAVETGREFADREWTVGDDDVRSMATPTTVRIDHVEADDLSPLFDRVFEQSDELRSVEDDGAGGLIFSRQLFFERLPVPTVDFDEWIRERYYDGERFLPPVIEERIGDVERLADSTDRLEAVRPLSKSVQIFEQINQRLSEKNPLFDRLSRYVRGALETDRSLLVLSESVKHAEILRYSLNKRGVISREELDSGPVSVVSPDTARDIEPHETLLVFGALHKQNAGFYVHPRISETIVLTYDRAWTTMIERQAVEFIDTLNSVVGGPDYSPYSPPQLVGDVEPLEEEPTAPSAIGDETTTPEHPPEESESETSRPASSKSKAEILADAMDTVSAREYREESGRYDREVRHFSVETEAGESFDFTNHDTVLRQRTNGAVKEYHWVNPDRLTPGDTFVTVPDDVEQEIWREQLEEFYEDGVDADEAVDRLEEWVESLREIWIRVDDELAVDPLSTQQRIHEEIYQRISTSNDDFDRARGTVRTWFDSVIEADGPIDLVEDPSLTIGPRSFRDIEAIGRTFNHDTLVNEAKQIEAAMEGLRTINRQQGRELHDEIRDQMNAGADTRISRAAQHHSVKEVFEVEDEE